MLGGSTLLVAVAGFATPRAVLQPRLAFLARPNVLAMAADAEDNGAPTSERLTKFRQLNAETRAAADSGMFATLRSAFYLFDIDDSGTLDRDAMQQLLERLGMELSDEEMTKLTVAADPEGNGMIDFGTFMNVVAAQPAGIAGLYEHAASLLETSLSEATLAQEAEEATRFLQSARSELRLDAETKLQLAILLSTNLLVQMGIGMVIVALPIFATTLGLGTGGVGLIIALPQLTKLLFNLPVGFLVDRYGRKPSLIIGGVLDAVGQYGTALATGLTDLTPARLLIGVGSATTATASQAYTLDVVGKFPNHSGLLLGLVQAVGFLAFALGPAVGGRLLERFDATMPFKVC